MVNGRPKVHAIRLLGHTFSMMRVEALLFAVCVFLLTPPFFVWNSISPLVFIAGCTVLTLRNMAVDSRKGFLFFMFVAFFLFASIRNESSVFGLLAVLQVCLLALADDAFLADVFESYVKVFAITIIPSLIVFLLINLGHVHLPHTTIPALAAVKDYDYNRYFFLVQDNDPLSLAFPRFCGYYDEPGVVGTIAGVILLCHGIDLRKRINIPILLAGMLSFSFAFYFVVLLQLVLFVRTRYKIAFALALAVGLFLVSETEIFQGYIYSRFFREGGISFGNNRAVGGFDDWYARYSGSMDYLFGLGLRAGQEANFGGSSYKDLIVSYGIVGFVWFLATCVLNAFFRLRFRREFVLYLVLLFVVVYQRPFITNYYYMFFIFASVFYLKKNARQDHPPPSAPVPAGAAAA